MEPVQLLQQLVARLAEVEARLAELEARVEAQHATRVKTTPSKPAKRSSALF